METLFKKSTLLGVFFFLISQVFTAQTNPIIDLVNTPNNDIDGQVVLCANDGSSLPHIFLCGAIDVANLVVNYPGSTLEWQLLDENSCANFGDNCSNKSQSCSYTTVASGDTFAVNADGKYRLRIDSGNGVFQNHYFHVFQNNLDLLYQKADIGCEPFGNITITNLGNLYGFQLVNADNNQVLVPFSANNGPAFQISANGNYRIEATQLDGNGLPIPNACLFSTDAIPISTSYFQVQASSTEADCSGVATVTGTVSNGSPNYTYELRFNDGLDGGRGTLIQVVSGQTASNYTFTGVGQGEYSVVGINSDGCEQSDIVTVSVDTSNTLTFEARVSQHITCKEGNILVDPAGGKPPYRYAVWQFIDESDNLITTYNSPNDIPASEFQTSEIFDILTPGNYSFVLIDRFDCFTISNSVDIEFVPPAEFAAATVTDVACFGVSSGAIQMNLIDDNGYQIQYYLFDRIITSQEANTPGFSFADAIASNSSGFFPGLADGEYSVVANMRKGNAECNYVETMAVEAPATELAGEAILIQPFTCTQTGTIRANNYGGGTAPYEFSLDGANWQIDDMFIGLLPGTYSIFIRDAGGCVVETNPIDILAVDEPDDLLFSPTQITCDDPTSDLTVTIVGGTAPFDIEITSPAIQGPTSIADDVAIFENLSPGTYVFNVTDATDCTYSESFTILPITPIGVVGQLINNLSCVGADDGSLSYTVDGFDPTFSYTITNSGGTSVGAGTTVATNVITLNNLPQDTYTITVTDDVTTCAATADVTIDAPATPLATTINVVDLTCGATGTNPGSVAVNATGGWGSYQYELTDPSNTTTGPQSSNVFDNLTDTSGTYTVTVTDAGGCITTATFSLNPVTPPVLEVIANSPCYDDTTGLVLTATVTSGGDGNFMYQLNNGGYTDNNVFSGLGPGAYTVDVVDGKNCTHSQTITVNPQMDVSATVQPIAACETSTDVLITASGGDGNFVYAVVPSGSSPTAGDFGASNIVTISTAGNYDVYARDNGGNVEFCEASDAVTIIQDPVLDMAVAIDPQVIPCAGSNNGSITINATGGASPYVYSVDGGANFQPGNLFVNLSSGDYTVVVQDSNGCEVSEVHNIPETFTLSASAAVTQSPTCNPSLGTEVRILNAQGGTEPYEYSFDGGNTYAASNSEFLQPGTHLLILRDANGCVFEMPVTIDPIPENPTFTHDITYDCTGEGVVTVTPSSTDFNYVYSLDGTNNAPADFNIFSNVSPGYHTVTVDYLPTTPLAPSVLLSESFGSGANTAISEVDPVYCYEPQNGTDNGCPHANAVNNINDGEYSVTQTITSPFGTWISPNDHTGDANGRYLAMNVGNVAGNLGIIYAKRNITVVANRDINISLWAINLLRQGTSGGDPNILIELVDGTGSAIASTTTGNIPKNNGPDDWRNYAVTLNPGANTTLDIVIRTFSVVTGGNDIAVDDIQATQAAEDCPQQEIFQVYVEEGLALAATITAQSDPLCVADNSGTITFSVENFDATAGFVYSTDGGGTFSAPQNTGSVTLNNLAAGTYNIIVQDASNAACSTSISATLTDPTPVVASATLSQEMSCTNMNAIITANASGGNPGYEYQLENDSGTVMTPFQAGTVFTVNTAGDYNIRVRDASACEDLTDTPITITAPETLDFDIAATTCYSGNNDASIQLNVTAGNGNYQFQINNGPWLSPSPITATTYNFDGLPFGNYSVNVKDGLGCVGIPQNVTINPALTANALLNNDLTCLVDANITVTANGGSGTYAYEWANTNLGPWNASGFSANIFTTSISGSYWFRVTDTTTPSACSTIVGPINVTEAETPVVSSVTPSDVLCFGEANGSLSVVIDTSVGVPPYTLNVLETVSNTNYGTQTAGLPAGTYEVTVTDDKGCVSSPVVATINQPDLITYDPVLTPITCGATGTDPGSISISNIQGGTAGYTILVNANNGYSATQTVATAGGSVDFTILDFGIYQVDVVDSNGCLAKTTEIIASPPDDLDIDVSISTTNCANGGTAVVTVSTIVGSGQYDFAILETFSPPYVDDPVNDYQPADDILVDPNTSTFTNLTPGVIYTFVVYDRVTLCYYFEVADAPIDTPSNLIAALDVNNISCTGADDGNVSFSLSGFDATTDQVGYQIFNFQSNVFTGFAGTVEVNPPGSPVAVPNFGALPRGEYYVLFTEVGGVLDQCPSASAPFSITESPFLLEVNATSTNDIECDDTGTITAIAQNGAAPYLYQLQLTTDAPPTVSSWTGTNTTGYFDGLPNNDYRIYVLDDYGCILFVDELVGLDPSPEISLTLVDECVDEGTFQVLVTLDNPGTAPYAISVNGSAFQVFSFNATSQYLVSGLSSGTGQTIAVRAADGCVVTEPFDIAPNLQFDAQLTALIDCEPAPDNNGEITISVSSGSGNYEYEISGPVNQARTALPPSPFVWDLASSPGLYTVILYDISTADALGNPCSVSKTIDVPALVVPAFTPLPVDVTCFNGSDGAIIVSETDLGVGPITYALTPAVDPFNTTTGRFENLPAGTYSITATASNACTTVINDIIVGQPDEIIVQNPAVVPFGCTSGNNPNNATITVDAATIIGGSGNYLVYEFINDATAAIEQRGTQTTYIETDLAGGNYTINVYDDNGCIGTATAVIPPYDELLNATIAVTPVTCVPGNDGALTVSVNSTLGDAARFEYSIDNGGSYQPTNVFNNLAAGNYLVTIRHIDTGCIITANATIEEPNTFAIEFDVVQNVVCFGTDSGEVTLTFTDAAYLGDFDYTIYDTNGTPTDETDDISVQTGTETVNTTTAVITLGAGTYRVEATQVSAPTCTQETVFSIGTPSEPISGLARTTDITCNPGADGIIEIYNVIGGWGDYTYYVGITPPAGAASFVASPRFENLVAGTYQAWARDVNGCEQLIDDNLVLADPAPITAALQVNAENCVGASGEIEVINVTGGQGSNYSYQLIRNSVDLGPPQNTPIFSGLADGSYEVRVSDQWGCEVTIGPEVLYTPMVPVYDVVQTIDCDADGEITITVTGGSGNFEYQLAHPDGGAITNNTGVFTGLTHSGNNPADYVFTVADLDTNPQCTSPLTVTLDKPTPVTVESILSTNLSCPGANDGTITINLEPTAIGVNDDPIYSYTIQNTTTAGPSIIQDSPVFNNLEPGDYHITIVSGRGCVASLQREITSPTPLDAAITNVVPFACDADNAVQMAQIEVTITNGTGTPDYFYSVNSGAFLPTNGEIFTYIATTAGDYDIVIRDANGCLFPLPTQTIDPLPQIVLDLTEGPADCPTGQEITVTSTGHSTAPAVDLTFELLETGDARPNLATDTQVFNITEPGVYTIRVTDNVTGCYETITYEVDPRPQYGVVLSAVTPITCFGDTDGTMEVTFTGYPGAYDYEVFNEDGTTAGISANNSTAHPLLISNVPAGNYFVRVSPLDYPYCDPENTLVQTVVSPIEMLDAEVEELLAAGCPDNMGEISVVPEGGYLPYDITLTHSGGQQFTAGDVNAHVFTALPSGSYTIEVVDAEGCIWNGAANVAPTPPIVASGVGTAPICYDNPDGTIVVTASGGSGSYNYFINYYDATGTTIDFTPSVPQQSNEFNFLGEGYYSVTVEDNMGCSDTTGVLYLDGPDQLIAELVLTTAMTCVDDAILTLTAVGGTAPFEYFNTDTSIWESFNNGSQHTYSVGEGTHYAQIRDANNCETISQIPVIINPIPPVDLVIEYASASVNCADAMTASIYAYAIGGIGNYTFDLILDGSQVATVTDPRTAIFENLSPGSYTVRVNSEGGCNPDEEPVVIDNPEPLIFTHEKEDVRCSGEENGAITLMLSGGGGGYQYAISPNLDQFFDEDPVQGLPAGHYRFENLAPGTYTVIVQDANECFYVEEIDIIDPEPLTINEGVVLAEVCTGSADGSATVNIAGGTAPYSTSFGENTNFVQDQVDFSGLAAGSYIVYVRDAMGCEENIVITIDGGVNLNATVEPVYECTGDTPGNYVNITLEDPTVIGDILYSLDSTNPADTQLNPDFRDIAAGTHYIAISHSNGCMMTFDFEIEGFEPLTLALEQNNLNEITAVAGGGLPDYRFIFDGIDNGNDNTFYITRSGTFVVTVIDENDCEVSANIFMEFIDIEIPNFFTPDGDGHNDKWIPQNIEGWPEILIKIYDRYGRVVEDNVINHNGWDGRYNDSELPTGDYWYVIKLHGERDDREFVGHFTLYR